VRRGFDHVAYARLVKRVVELAPRAVVATHHLPLVVLGRARRKNRLVAPLLGVVTDYTAHACWAEPGTDAFCVSCPRAAREMVEHGALQDRVLLTGIPVRAPFGGLPDVRDPLPWEPLRVLVTSGGFGVGPVTSIVRSFAGMQGVDLTVVCGAQEKLVRKVEAAAQESGIRANVLGFESNMAARVAEAHVIVGKAGGLTVTEALTAGRPMIVVGAVPGNEKVNEDFVVSGGAGFPAHATQVGPLAHWMRDRGVLAQMGRHARTLVLHRAADRVVDVASHLVWLNERVARAA
jgi:processive 1,2-diacylglycerol beta-glucosyltransferase